MFELARARAQAVVEHLSPDSEVAARARLRGSAAPVAELSSDRARVLAALRRGHCDGATGGFRGGAAPRDPDPDGPPRADRLIYVVTDLQARAGRTSRRRPLGGAAPRSVLLDVSGGAPWDNRAVVGLAAEPAPEEGAQGDRRRRRDRELRRRAGATRWASRCASTASRSRAASSTSPPTAARASASCTRCRRRQRASGGGGDRPRQLHARRPPRLSRRGVARAARAARRRRPTHGPHRGRDVLPGGCAARRAAPASRSRTVLPDDSANRDLDAYGAVFMANVARPTRRSWRR